MPVAETLLGPDVNAALVGKFGGECRDSQRGRDKEERCRQKPQRYRDRAGVGGRRQPPDSNYGRDVEQDQVAQAELAAELGFAGGLWNEQSVSRARTGSRWYGAGALLRWRSGADVWNF